MSWLDPIFAQTQPGARTLVLCRHAASVRMLRTEAVSRGGVLGLEVMTPLALALAVCNPDAFPTGNEPDFEPDSGEPPVPAILDWSMPDGHPWASVAARSGLRRKLLQHVHRARLDEPDLTLLPEPLLWLLMTNWGVGPADPLRELLARAQKGDLGAFAYERVFAVGFGDLAVGLPVPPGPHRYFGRLLQALGAIALHAPDSSTATTLSVVESNDPVGEARWVAREVATHCSAGGALDDVLILVPARRDEDRIRAAITRSGLSVARDEPHPLRAHALTALARRLLAWCTDEADPLVHGEDLRRLFTSPILNHSWPAEAQDLRRSVAETIALHRDDKTAEPLLTNPDAPFISRHQVSRTLHACHLVRAPLSAWLSALESVSLSLRSSTSFVMHGRLQWLAAQRGPTLGHLRALLSAFGVRAQDTVARGILAALRDGAELRATDDAFDEVLSGAASSGRCDRGARMTPYAQYDGRPSRLLLLTGLHSKGLGAGPAPDPFFEAGELAVLGSYVGEAHIEFVLAQARAAMARCHTALGCVCRSDASGRAVVTVGGLDLQPTGERIVNYGIDVETPERRDHNVLVRNTLPVPVKDPGPGPEADAEAEHAARMATVEWVRAGSFVSGVVAGEWPEVARLPALLDLLWERVPMASRPWLGEMSEYAAECGLSAGPHSVSRTIEPLTHCLFQAFVKGHLRLETAEVLVEDLDSREVGDLIHTVMERLGNDPGWRVPKAQRAVAIADLRQKLRAETQSEAWSPEQGHTPAVRAAQTGLLERWCRHLERYVEHRVVDLDSREPSARSYARALLLEKAKDEVFAIAKRADPQRVLKGPSFGSVMRWVTYAVEALTRSHDPFFEALLDGDHAGVNQGARAGVLALASDGAVLPLLEALRPLYESEFRYGWALYGPVLFAQAEWGFGPLELVFGDAPSPTMTLRGRLDLLSATGDPGQIVLHINDYKTGSAYLVQKGLMGDKLSKGLQPQLYMYALALESAVKEGNGPAGLPESSLPPWLSYDYVKSPESGDFGFASDHPGQSLDEMKELIAELYRYAQAADYRALPHPESCPVLTDRGHDYCPASEVCRLRRYPGAEPNDTKELGA